MATAVSKADCSSLQTRRDRQTANERRHILFSNFGCVQWIKSNQSRQNTQGCNKRRGKGHRRRINGNGTRPIESRKECDVDEGYEGHLCIVVFFSFCLFFSRSLNVENMNCDEVNEESDRKKGGKDARRQNDGEKRGEEKNRDPGKESTFIPP